MAKQIRLAASAALIFALQTGALAQTAAQTAPNTGSQQVLGLAPQLSAFAGSDANFQALVNGLLQGIPVTLTTLTADGFLQTVTFTPAGALSVADVARLLEAARQQLISRGIANPTAQQIGIVLTGGQLPAPSGATQVNGLVQTLAPGGVQPGVLANVPRPSAPVAGTANPSNNLIVDIRPLTQQTQSTSASTGGSTSAGTGAGTGAGLTAPASAASPNSNVAPVVRFTSDNTRLGNTSDSPLPPSTPPLNTSGSLVTQGVPTINPATGVSNGGPSAAAQMQGRR
jgi:hypothetical protein